MKPAEFIASLEDAKIVAAIQAAEQRTSGEIRVWISRKSVGNAVAAAQQRFTKLRMQKTRDRNAVLLYFAPRTRIFAIIGDTGVHAKCGAEFWEKVAAQITLDIHQGTITEAIVHAVHTVGELLAAHFPYESGDKNELSDAVGHD